MYHRHKNIKNRFLSYIEINKNNDCWTWKGTVTKKFLKFYFKYKSYSAKKFSYELKFNEIPKGFYPVNNCNNNLCVNPDHLELVDHGKMLNRNKQIVDYEEHFWNKVNKTTNDNDCWLWTAGQISRKRKHNYGAFYFENKRIPAHIFSYIMAYGEIPKGLIVRHKCDTALCCNPNHLEIGTHKDNTQDMLKRKRHQFGENHYSKRTPGKTLKGSKIGTSKLTEKQVIDIRNSYKLNEKTDYQLARKYDIDITTVQRILQRKTWKHI